MVEEEISLNSSILDFDTSETTGIAYDEPGNKSKENRSNKDINENTYKTELCRTWVEKNYCPYREKCRFAHGKKELHEKQINVKNYKKKECISFYKKGYCPYGPRCHFKHDERKFHEIGRTYYQFKLNSLKMIEKYFDNLRIQPQDNAQQVRPLLSVFKEIHKLKFVKLGEKKNNSIQKQKKPNLTKPSIKKPSSPFIPIKYIASNSKSRGNISISNKILDSYM